MFANFEEAFFDKTKISIPKEITKYLSKSIPDGFKYESAGLNACVIKPTSPEFNIEMQLDLSEDLIRKFNLSDLNKVMEFMYRTQRRLKVIPDKQGCIKINNEKININDLVKFPLDSRNTRGELYIYPEKFPPAFKVQIEGEGIVKSIFIKRQPYEDMHKIYFKNVKDETFQISYLLDEKTMKIRFGFKLNIENLNSVKEILESLKIYRAYLNGNMKFGNIKLPNPQSENKIIDNTIEFWNKICNLEKKLNVNFLIEFPLKDEDIYYIKQLYMSFIEKKPYKQYVTMSKVRIKAVSPSSVNYEKGKSDFTLLFIRNIVIKVWGKTINVFSSGALFDFKISDVIEVNKDNLEYNLVLEDAPDKEMYQSIRYFMNEEYAGNYVKDTKNIEELKNAKYI